MQYDVFLSHASEDKDDVVRPLAEHLRKLGLKVWLDEFELALGDSLRRSIDRGLLHSKYGVVVLSRAFLAKEWPQKELDALVAREDGRGKVILPVWHELSWADVASYSPILADKLAVSTSKGLPYVAERICHAVRRADAVHPQDEKDRPAEPKRTTLTLDTQSNRRRNVIIVGALVLLLVLITAAGIYMFERDNAPFVGTIAYSGDVRGIDFSPNGTLIATGGGNDHTVLLWNAITGKQVRVLMGESVVSSVAFSGDGTRLATDSALFDVATGERIARLGGGYDVAFSPDGRFLATASGYQPSLGTRLFDQRSGAQIRQISEEYSPSLAFSYDGNLLATATGYLAKGVRLWNLENHALARTLAGPSAYVAFSSDGRYVATAGGGTVRLFRPSTGEHLRDISGHIVAFSPDGRVLATVGDDRRVRLHDPANGNPIRTLENVYANELVFSPDGERIGTVGPDKSIQVSKVR